MNRRIRKKHARWMVPPRERGALTVEQAAGQLGRIMQRLRNRNEAWFVLDRANPSRRAVLLSPRYVEVVLTDTTA